MSARKAGSAGAVYVLTHTGHRSVKVGYTKLQSHDRVEQLQRRGWTLFRYLHVATPQMARDIEQATLLVIRHQLLVPQHLTKTHMPTVGGWTETSSLSLITAAQAWDVVCEQAGIEQLAPVVKPVSQRRSQPPPHRRTKGDSVPFSPVAKKQHSHEARARLAVNGHHH